MSLSLPSFSDGEAFDAWRAQAQNWLPAALDIARSHGLPAGDPVVFATGTNLVLGLGPGLVLKVFPPILRGQFLSERASLRQLHGRLPLPIPEIVSEGERDGWPYLVMTRLSGALGSEIWPDLPEDQKERILRQIGETIAQVQAAPLGEIAGLGLAWPDFLARQIAGCRQRQIGMGLPERYWDELDALLAEAPKLVPADGAPVILTGEYIPENFLLARDGDGWRLGGLFDFGDVMSGWGEYDLLGPSCFMTAGRPGRVRSLLEGFGYDARRIDPALPRRLLALTFLHRASDPMRKIAIPDWHRRAATLADLERMLWPIERF